MKKIFLFLIVCLCQAGMRAQETPQWSIQSVNLQALDYADTFKEGSVFHIPSGQLIQASFQINLVQRSLADGESPENAPSTCYYKINDNDVQQVAITEKGDGVYEFHSIIPNSSGIYQFSVGLKSSDLSQLSESVNVWEKPTVTASLMQSTYEGESVELAASTQGAVNGVWGFKWYTDGNEIEGNRDKAKYSFVAQAVTSKTLSTYQLHWEYGYGDKKWFHDVLEYSVNTYPIPEYDFAVSVNGVAQIVPTLLPTDQVFLNVLISKGNSNESTFKYEWKDGTTNVGSNSSYQYTAANTSSTTISKRLEVTVTNQIPGGKSRTSNVMYYQFSVQSPPTITNLSTTDRTIYNPDASISLEVKPNQDIENIEWVYEWKKSGINQSNTASKYVITKEELHNNSNTEPQSHTYELNVTCKGKTGSYNEGKLYPLSQSVFTYNIEVLPDPKLLGITLPESAKEDGKGLTFTNHPITYSINHQGGDVNGWEYEVTGGATLTRVEGDDLIITFDNNGTSKILKTFSIIATNTITKNGTDQRSFQQDCETLVYPTPTIEWTSENLDNYFYGSQPQWSVGIVGDNPGTWTYQWTLDGEEITMPFNIPESYSDSYKHEVKVIGTNTCKGEKWGTSSVIHQFTAWRPGQLSDLILDYVDGTNIYEGTTFGLSAVVKGGYDKGWSYKWTRLEDNSTIDGKVVSTPATRLTNGSSETQHYVLSVENAIPGLADKFSDSRTQQVTIWRNAEQIPTDFSITNQSTGSVVNAGIREGNTIMLNTSAAQYGYQETWQYLWNGISSNNTYSYIVPSIIQSNNRKATLENTISLKVSNFGPNGSAWEETELHKTLTVYRKPQTPTSLVKKGNGSSRTLIAITSLNDDKLQQNEYYLVFGYQKGDGSILTFGEPQRQQTPGQTRWSTHIPAEYYNNESRLCVYSLWKYDDGVFITSGLRFLNGSVNDVWDGSDYAGSTRVDGGDATSISELSKDEEEPQEMYESYSITGISSAHLVKGLNIVRMSDGTIRKIMKK